MHVRIITSMAIALIAAPAAAQLGLPGVGDTLGPVTGRLDGLVDRTLSQSRVTIDTLAAARIDRLTRLVRDNRGAIEFDATSQPARRGELLLEGSDEAAIKRAELAGFAVVARENFADLGLSVVRLAVPSGVSLARAEKQLHALLPDATVSADQLYFASGSAASPLSAQRRSPAPAIPVAIGVIDSAPGPSLTVEAMRGFARGAPFASNHGSAVVSLLQQAGAKRIFLADVYGKDQAGGNALAIVRALGWLLSREVRVISISLVGPDNPLLARAIAAMQARGTVIVAAVGNDGPAAPPSFPASYPDVVAVTAVDGRDRVLVEAGRALHLDYAAPGADMLAANVAGQWKSVRGTSFATPLVAARAAHAIGDRRALWRTELDSEARDLGRKGPDPVFGRGLICGQCRRAR